MQNYNFLLDYKAIFSKKIGKADEPSFLMVITGSQFAYRISDGVYVAPLGCLQP